MARPVYAHPITIYPHPGRVSIRFDGAIIVDTDQALMLKEAGYPPVLYLPKSDADMERLERTAKRTHCPFKGDAHYYAIQGDILRAENAVWCYENPIADVAPIAGYLAFDAKATEIIED